MDSKKTSICIFVHYSTSDTLPYYVEIYINELSIYFDKVKVLTNNSKISDKNTAVNSNISFEYFENRGYDFGMIYRYVSKQNLGNYSELALVNDSNILLNKLDKVFLAGRASGSDFWGIIDSSEKPWFSTHKENYHIQSHFLVLNEKAIKLLPSFFNQLNVNEIMGEADPKQLRRMVIDRWEIGLSQYFLQNQLHSFSYIKSENTGLIFKTKKQNLTHSHYAELLHAGYPLLKKKLAVKKRKMPWVKKKTSVEPSVIKYSNWEWDIKRVMEEVSR